MTWPVAVFDSIDSTNTEAKRRAASGDLGPVWFRALRQTAGRGRFDRQWISPGGNLFATALFAESGGFNVATRLPFAAGLAVCDAVSAVAPDVNAQLKWPNDVRVGGAKICGILIESGTQGGHLWIAAGIGINVAMAPEAGQASACLAKLSSKTPDADAVFEALTTAFAVRLEQARAGFTQIREDWHARAEAIGQTVRIVDQEGVFLGLGDDGAARLRLHDGSEHSIRAGDMMIPREE